MSNDTLTRTKFQQLVNPLPPGADPDVDDNGLDADYMWRGRRFRVVPMGQAPLLQFRLTVNAQESLQIKYAYITFQSMTRQNPDGRNEIVIVVRDSMRIRLCGFNLQELDDALLMQRVLEIQAVSLLQAEAALKQSGDVAAITEVHVEHGRFDVENRRWMLGSQQ